MTVKTYSNNINNLLGNQGPLRNTLEDWQIANEQVLSNAKQERYVSNALRDDTTNLENSTKSHIQYNQDKVNFLLKDRISEVNERRDALKTTIDAIEAEIQKMNDSEAALESALMAKRKPLEVAEACLSLRKGRVAVDDVDDNVEKSLHEEVRIIKYISHVLKNHLDHARESLRRMKSAEHTLEHDMADKTKDISLENACDEREYTNPCEFVQEHDDPYTNLTQWEAFTAKNIQVAEAERSQSQEMRDVINNVLSLTANDLSHITLHVDDNFSIRINEVEEGKAKLEKELAETLDEMRVMEGSIQSLEDSLTATNEPMNLARGQQNIRHERPRVELCDDDVHKMLKTEVSDISDARDSLLANLKESKTKVKHLRRNELRVREDLRVKTESLRIDMSCVDIRADLCTRL